MKSFIRKGIENTLASLVKIVIFLCGKNGARTILKFFKLPLPYSVARLLSYKGIVYFTVAGEQLQMRSYNTPIETTIDWRGVFKGREGFELMVWHTLSGIAKAAFDVGANNGIYSLVASTHEGCAVYAYEPVPVVFEMLQENILLSKKTQVIAQKKIVCDTVGHESLYVPRTGWVDTASINKTFADTKKRGAQLQEITCEAVTLDSELATANATAGMVLVKIDVEGAELRVLKGMQAQLQRGRTIVLIELLNQQTFASCNAHLPEHYTVYAVQPHEHCLAATASWKQAVKNYLYIPESCHEAFQAACGANTIRVTELR